MHRLGWEYIIIKRARHPLIGCAIGSRCDPVLNDANAHRSGVLVEAVKRYLLETPDPVEMVFLDLVRGVRRPFQAREIPGVLPLQQ